MNVGRSTARTRLLAVALLGLLSWAVSGCGGPASSVTPAGAVPGGGGARAGGQTVTYAFTSIDDPVNPNFTEVLTLNNENKIGGFYGSGAPSDPRHGFMALPPYGAQNFRTIDFPSATDTIVTSLNNTSAIAGTYTNKKSNVYGFAQTNGLWTTYKDPLARSDPKITTLDSINDASIGVGTFVASTGIQKGFELDLARSKFDTFKPPASTNTVATGIMGRGDICGYLTTASGGTMAFLLRQGTFYEFSFPGAASTYALGITLHDKIVGYYVDASGTTHGFLLTEPTRSHYTAWQSLDEPNAAGTTVVTGINNHGNVVGYYVDAAGSTHGFFATPGA